jgi:HemY protein
MAQLEEAEAGDIGRARQWMARAVHAALDPVWTADGLVAENWMPVSPATGRLDAFQWRAPVADLTPRGPLLEPAPSTPAIAGPSGPVVVAREKDVSPEIRVEAKPEPRPETRPETRPASSRPEVPLSLDLSAVPSPEPARPADLRPTELTPIQIPDDPGPEPQSPEPIAKPTPNAGRGLLSWFSREATR